jgi:hypothetical protein
MKTFELSDEELEILEEWYYTAANEWTGGDKAKHAALAAKFGFEIDPMHKEDDSD